MIKINLLPYRERAKVEDLTRQIALIAISFIALILLVGGVQLYMSLTIGGLEKDVKQQEDRLVELTKVIGDIERYKRDAALLDRKLAVIESLEQLSGLVPVKDIWLEKLTEKESGLTIEGVARNNIAVALFMKNLVGSSFIKSVDLTSTREKEISGIKLQQFVVSCVLKKKGS
jgi:Tfp pilus assembly protein PilN